MRLPATPGFGSMVPLRASNPTVSYEVDPVGWNGRDPGGSAYNRARVPDRDRSSMTGLAASRQTKRDLAACRSPSTARSQFVSARTSRGDSAWFDSTPRSTSVRPARRTERRIARGPRRSGQARIAGVASGAVASDPSVILLLEKAPTVGGASQRIMAYDRAPAEEESR